MQIAASPTPKTIHGASTIRSVPVIRVAPSQASAVTVSAPGGRAAPVQLKW